MIPLLEEQLENRKHVRFIYFSVIVRKENY